MKVAIIYNKDLTGVINQFGMQNKEVYNPKTVKLVAESLEKEGHNVRIAEGNMYIIEKLQEFMPRVRAVIHIFLPCWRCSVSPMWVQDLKGTHLPLIK